MSVTGAPTPPPGEGAHGAELTAQDAARLERCVRGGGVAVFPADTVYGICCDPDDEAAARRLFELKGRPPARSCAVMLFSLAAALRELPTLAPIEQAALRALLPGAVTVLLANPQRRFGPACSADPETLGLRVPALAPPLAALAGTGVALMQSSANRSGGPDARRLADVPAELREGVDLVLDGGELPGVPSTVVDLRELGAEGRWRVLREGAISERAIGELLAGVRAAAIHPPC